METLLGSDLSVGPMTLVNQKDKLEESAEQKREGDKPGSLIVSNIPALLTNKVIIYSELYRAGIYKLYFPSTFIPVRFGRGLIF